MDAEEVSLFEDTETLLNPEDSRNDATADSTLEKTGQPSSSNSVRDIENWFMESLKAVIPADMHSIYINENNVLFSFGALDLEFDLRLQTECVLEMTNRGKRSLLSCFDTITYYTNLTYRNEAQRRRISLDYKTDPAFLRVIEPRTGKFILSNLIRCSSQQQKGLRNYVDYVKRNIFSFPLLEELNRFALSQKLAYKRARLKLWFIMSLAEELKLVEGGKSFKKYAPKDGVEVNRNLLDKNVTLRYFRTTQKQAVSDPSAKLVPSSNASGDDSGSQFPLTKDEFASMEKLSMDPLVDSSFNYTQIEPGSNSSIPLGSANPFESNSSSVQDQSQAYLSGLGSMSLPDSASGVSLSGSAIGFTSLHIGEVSTPVRKDPNFQENKVDSFDSNFMKLIDQEAMPLLEFDTFMDNSKSTLNFGESSQTGWQALQMIKKSKIKVEEPKMGQFVQKGLDKILKKKQSFAFKNAVTTISVLEAACKLYGKGPKWSNPNKREFELANKTKRLVYVKPSKSVRENELGYQYLMQYASVHQKLNGGVRQEHAVQYGLIEINKPVGNEPKTYTVNREPWNIEKFARKWQKLAAAIKFSPWLISRPKESLDPPKPEAQASDSALVLEKPAADRPVSPEHEAQGGLEPVEEVPLASELPDQLPDGKAMPKDLPSEIIQTVEVGPLSKDPEFNTLSKEPGVNTAADNPDLECEDVVPEHHDQEEKPEGYVAQSMLNLKSEEELVPNSDDRVHFDEPIEPPELNFKVKSEPLEPCHEFAQTSTTDAYGTEDIPETNGESSFGRELSEEPEKEVAPDDPAPIEPVNVASQADLEEKPLGPAEKLPGPDGKQMKLTELFKYVYTKISKAKQLPEFPELRLTNMNREAVKKELEKFTHFDREAQFTTKRRKVLDEELEPMPENYVKIGKPRAVGGSQTVTDSDDEDYKRVDGGGDMDLDAEAPEVSKLDAASEKAAQAEAKRAKLSKREKIMRMREIMKSMIEFEAIESEDENLSDPEDIKRSLQLLKDKLNNPSEAESEIESETEIAREMKDFIGEVEINEEDEEIARLKFMEDQMVDDDALLKKVMSYKEKGEMELTRKEERLRLLNEAKKNRRGTDVHLSDFESSDEESGEHRRHKVKVTREDIDRLLRARQNQKEMSKEEQLEQFIDYKLTEANVKLPTVEEVTVSTSFIEVPKAAPGPDAVLKIKNRRDMVDNMFNEGLDSIFSNIDEYRSDSSMTVNPFGTPSRSLDKLDNSTSKSPKRPALVMKSFRWDHSQAKPGNTTTVRNFRGFTGFHNLPSSFGQDRASGK